MNSTDTTTGGYTGSYMYSSVIGAVASTGGSTSINTKLYRIFGSHLLTTPELLSISVNTNLSSCTGAGVTDSWTWYNCQAVLMSEVEVYGTTVFSSSGCDVSNANVQLPLFRLMPRYMQAPLNSYWLRSVTNSKNFCLCDISGYSNHAGASTYIGVRPRFVIG